MEVEQHKITVRSDGTLLMREAGCLGCLGLLSPHPENPTRYDLAHLYTGLCLGQFCSAEDGMEFIRASSVVFDWEVTDRWALGKIMESEKYQALLVICNGCIPRGPAAYDDQLMPNEHAIRSCRLEGENDVDDSVKRAAGNNPDANGLSGTG